jgi:aminoglycoside/choline kinase family phosphotransferase
MALPRARGVPAPLRDRVRVHGAIHRMLDMNDRLPECLLHGDPHLGNMYFPGDRGIGFLDWQRMMRGPWIWDVAYTLCGFLSPNDRRAHEKALLRDYLTDLTKLGAPAPSFEDAWTLYRAQLFYGMVWVVVPPGTQPEDAIESVSTRFAQAIVDLDAFEVVARL